jgi:hypothetical protein
MRENPEEFVRQYFRKHLHPIRCGWYRKDRLWGINSGPFGNISTKQPQLTNLTFGMPSTQVHRANEYLPS